MIQDLEKEGYRISTDKSELDLNVIHGFLSKEAYWSKGIPFEIIKKGIDNSFCFGVYHKLEQVGFARLITDYATYAYLADVFIVEEHRGKGLSKWLMDVIINHPEVQGLRRWTLATLDAHELYKQFDFTSLAKPETFMELYKPEVYKNN